MRSDWVSQCFIQSGVKNLQCDWTTSLDTCCSAWLSSWWKHLSLYSVWAPLTPIYAKCFCPPDMHRSEEPRSTSSVTFLLGFGRLLLGAPEAPSSSEQPLVPLASEDKHFSPQSPWWSSAELAPVNLYPSCSGGPKTGCNMVWWVLSKWG